MDQAAVFFAGSILTGLGFIVVVICILIINNLFYEYWKPIKWIKFEDKPVVQWVEEVKQDETKIR